MREMGYGLEHSIFHFPSSIFHLRWMEPRATGQGLCEIFSPGASVPRPVLAFDKPQVFRGQAEFAFQTLTNLCQRRTLRTQNQWPQSPQMRNERGEISSKPQTPSTREATSRKPQERPQTAPDRASEPESAESRATRLLKRVGLAERLSHHPGQLSGGERQRVAVVRALINQPQLLLADEPTGSLDYASAQQLGELLVELNREEGVTLLVVTHARELAKRMGLVMELKDGRLSTMGEWKPSE